MKFYEDEIEFRFRDIEEGIFEAELKAHTEFTELVRTVLYLPALSTLQSGFPLYSKMHLSFCLS